MVEGLHTRIWETVRRIAAEAAKTESPEVADAIRRHAKASEGQSRIEGIHRLARHRLTVHEPQLDRDPWVLNVLNGTVDLRTGELRPHDPADRITKVVGVRYEPQAACPLWTTFLERIFDGSEELIEFLRRSVGYSLTGRTDEQCLFICYGTGRNGKTVFLETLKELAGDYGQTTPTTTLLDKGSNQRVMSNDVARLRGARFVTASETEDNTRLAEGQVKQLTGGDTVAARFLYGEHFEFRPQCKIWLICNHKPRIRGQDEGVWSRIRLVPFNVYIPKAERDTRLAEKLRGEAPGILAWAVGGAVAWAQSGLGRSHAVEQTTRLYRNEMDLLGAFLDESCAVHDDLQVTAKDLYARYAQWCQGAGERPQTKRNFGLRMAERGFESIRLHGGVRAWRGLDVAMDDDTSSHVYKRCQDDQGD
jgi:putative DNA primase/helicase